MSAENIKLLMNIIFICMILISTRKNKFFFFIKFAV